MKSFSELLLKFESFLIFEQRLAKLTVSSYLSDINIFFSFIKKERKAARFSLSIFNQSAFSDFLFFESKTFLKPSSFARRVASLSSFSKFLSSKLNQTPIFFDKHFFTKNKKALPFFLSLNEFAKVSEILFDESFLNDFENLSFEQARNKIIFIFLYTFGLRASELIDLTMNNISIMNGCESATLNVTGKGNKLRVLPIPSMLIPSILFYFNVLRKQELSNFFFNFHYLFFAKTFSSTPAKLSRQYIWALVKDFALASGISKSFSPHKFRHSIATHLLTSGANLRLIQDFLGHSSLATVQIYTHLDLSDLRTEYDQFHLRA